MTSPSSSAAGTESSPSTPEAPSPPASESVGGTSPPVGETAAAGAPGSILLPSPTRSDGYYTDAELQEFCGKLNPKHVIVSGRGGIFTRLPGGLWRLWK